MKKDVVILNICPMGGCPRIGVSGNKAFFRDDYKGNIAMSAKLLRKLSALK